MTTYAYDVVIVGASFGGVAAALAAAADSKVRVVLLDESLWVGGQATSQGLSRWDEAAAALTETSGSTKTYRDLRNAIRAWYAAHATLSSAGKAMTFFNPGFARAGQPFAADPSVAHEVLAGMLAALSSRLDVRLGVTLLDAAFDGGIVRSVTVRSGAATDVYQGHVFLDATDLGDLLPHCSGLPWVIGAESRADTDEQDAPDVAHPEWIQPFTVPVALELRPETENHAIAKPPQYDAIRANQDFRIDDGDIATVLRERWPGGDTVWNYRQYVDAANFADDRYACSRTTINVGSIDYQAKAIPSGSPADDAQTIEQGRAAALAYVYYLQHDVPRDDGAGTGYPNLAIRADAFGRPDGTAPLPYIRESRRIVAETRIVRADIDAGSSPKDAVRGARSYRDSCGIGWYNVDVHAAVKGEPQIGTPFHNFATLPFQIPLGALLPKDASNLVAACKNIGTTHLTSGAYRVHPVEWAIGEAAGVFAAYCITQQLVPKDAWRAPERVLAFQRRLLARGIPITWWDDIFFEDDATSFAAVHLCAAQGLFAGDDSLSFHPNDELSDAAKTALDERVGTPVPWPDGITRRDAAVLLCRRLDLPL